MLPPAEKEVETVIGAGRAALSRLDATDDALASDFKRHGEKGKEG